jgi:hypothetical protein
VLDTSYASRGYARADRRYNGCQSSLFPNRTPRPRRHRIVTRALATTLRDLTRKKFHIHSGKKVYTYVPGGNYFPSAVQEGHKVQEKYTYGLWGAAAGALALAILGFTWGDWHTASGVKRVSEAAVMTALIPACVKEVMADPTASAELKVRRTTDYDDIVRDYRKREIGLADLGYQFNRQCGRAIEALMAKSATKS